MKTLLYFYCLPPAIIPRPGEIMKEGSAICGKTAENANGFGLSVNPSLIVLLQSDQGKNREGGLI